MAIVSMRHLTLYGLKKDRKSIMELLQRRGVVEITPCPVEDERYQPPDVSAARAVFDKRIHVMTQALAVGTRGGFSLVHVLIAGGAASHHSGGL